MERMTNTIIINTARRLIKETNTAEIPLSKIANELGVTHAAIYKHFKNKQALWEAVAADWFEQTIINNVQLTPNKYTNPQDELHDWLWAFVNAKKTAYNNDPQMFMLNTYYVDNNPLALHDVLISAYKVINRIMGYNDVNFEKAEAILSAFSVFTLPNFKETWNLPDYQSRFELLWQLIRDGLTTSE